MNISKPNEGVMETILSLSPQAIFDGSMGEAKPTDEKIQKLVQPLLDKGCFYLAATEAEQLLGWVLLGTSKDQFTEEKNGFIYELFVLKEYRGNGCAKVLMDAAIHYFKQEGFIEVRLSAKAENLAVKLYENFGFHTRTISMSLKL